MPPDSDLPLCCLAREAVFSQLLKKISYPCPCRSGTAGIPFVGGLTPSWAEEPACKEELFSTTPPPHHRSRGNDTIKHVADISNANIIAPPAMISEESTTVPSNSNIEISDSDVTPIKKKSEFPTPLDAKRSAAILEDLKGKRVYLFLDYDGTLTPIVNDPSRAYLPERMRNLLVNLAPSCAKVAIVTGRALRSLRTLTALPEDESGGLPLLLAASHGFHIVGGSGTIQHQVGAQYIPKLREAAIGIGRALSGVEGVMFEDNDFAISVHFRNATDPWAEEAVETAIQTVLSGYPCLRVTRGKAVRELRVNVHWDKGKAVAWLLQSMGVDPISDPSVRVLYLGDDVTDEDAFKFLRMLPRSLGLLVSDAETMDRHSDAHFSLEGTSGVESFLAQLQQLLNE